MSANYDHPPQGTPIHHGQEDGYDRMYVSWYFEPPDFAQLAYGDERGSFTVGWATELGARDTHSALQGVLRQYAFRKGVIVLDNEEGPSRLYGDVEDVVAEMNRDETRVLSYELRGLHMRLRWGPAWPVDFHDIPTNEITMTALGLGNVARMMVDQSMATTARPGLRESVDSVLNSFSKHVPALAL